MYYSTIYKSPIGDLTLASDGDNLIGLWTEGQKYHGKINFDLKEDNNIFVFDETEKWLNQYFKGNNQTFQNYLYLLLEQNLDKKYGKYCAKYHMVN
ncbi:hypothetical protein [Methanobrevibacter sp. DSM 116169]|uniref:hypothetical protein n=1 Tax=Methanobrevibacter sp. DSM 116169 TaxID=3242727 RepID=UPI0038FBE93F